MEGTELICPACGKQNPANARFCYDCGKALVGVTPTEEIDESASPDAEAPSLSTDTPTVDESYPETQPQTVQPEPPSYTPPPAEPAYPATGYPPPHSMDTSPPPSQPPRRGRVRCCAIGCLVVLIVSLIGLPILHVTVIRPFIEREIYKQVQRSLDKVSQSNDLYGTDTEIITESQLNQDAQDAWDYIPGSSDAYIYLTQDRIRLELKIYGVKVWASADLRVDSNGYFVVKSLKMSWLLNVLFSESALKREIANYANENIVQPRKLFVLAFQVTDGNLFIAYKTR